jgi:hypothetical protein
MSIPSRRLQYQHERQVAHRRTLDTAKRLGVTAHGLELLAQAVATGRMRGGVGMLRLVAQGYATERTGQVGGEITDAGREIVRRARELGW